MRIERVSDDQFTIFVSFDDLTARGYTREKLWNNLNAVRDLFSEMMYEASDVLGFELEGLLLVHVNLMQSQGLHIIVTQKWDASMYDDEYIEMEVTLDESNELIYEFADFEDIIRVSNVLASISVLGGQLYVYNNLYYMIMEHNSINLDKEDLIAVMSEFGSPSLITSFKLKEYGKAIILKNAVKRITETF